MIEKSRYLITTSDPETWKKDEPVLLLGEWCINHNKISLKDVDYRLVKPYGIGHKNRDKDITKAREIEKKIIKLFFKNLFKIGYRYFDLEKRTKKDIFLIRAFQRRFLPKKVTGIIDQKTYIISHFLAKREK